MLSFAVIGLRNRFVTGHYTQVSGLGSVSGLDQTRHRLPKLYARRRGQRHR
jgi:hypothetical protein